MHILYINKCLELTSEVKESMESEEKFLRVTHVSKGLKVTESQSSEPDHLPLLSTVD